MRAAVLLLVALALFGCGQQTEVAPVVDAPEMPSTVAAVKSKSPAFAPDFKARPAFGIATRKGNATVGQTLDQALEIFAEPPGSFSQSELPPSLDTPYEARGWQKQNEGCGFILFEGRVAAIVYQLDRVKSDRLDELLTLQRNAFGKEDKPLLSKHVNYWFWNGETKEDVGTDSLMVCATEAKPGLFNITIAAGAKPVMQALGMTEDAASRDATRAEDLLQKKKAPGRANQAKGQ